jgi:3-hydroxyisobutyrate dehydrogenase-like beta-hydroxyacid dehydrogenase
MAKLGFLGLGIMGGPMAIRLVESGQEIAVWSHSRNKVVALAEKGAIACSTPAEVARRSDCIFLCVGNTEMSREVILGKNGLVEGASKGSIIADCSTISPATSRSIAAELSNLGIDFLDSPCTGSKAGAEGGTLTFMVGGSKDAFERVRPFFGLMGKLLYYCGTAGMGLHAKLSQNMILGNLLQAFNESLVLSTKAGLDPEMMLDILNNSAAKSGLLAIKAPMVFARNFTTNFSVKWLEKDMELMLESAAELNVPAPLTSLSRQLYRAAIAKGFGEEDICGSIRVLEDITGCTVISQSKPDTTKA